MVVENLGVFAAGKTKKDADTAMAFFKDERCTQNKKFCKENGFMEISGEDINSPRQKFIFDALKLPEFSNLIDSTWELIRHEKEN